MKKQIGLFLMLCLCLGLLTAQAAAAEVVDSGPFGESVTWTLTDDGVLTISGTGAAARCEAMGQPWGAYREQIVTAVVEEGVEALSGSVFFQHPQLRKIQLPASLLRFGSGDSFNMCPALEEILVDAENPNFCSVDGVLYNKDRTILRKVPGAALTQFTVPDTVRQIFYFSFMDCALLEEVVIPKSVNSFGGRVFLLCENLKKITFEGSAPTFEEDTFQGVDTTCCYPADNATWTAEKRQNYGGNLNWSNDPDSRVTGTCGKNVKWKLSFDGILTISGSGAMEDYPFDYENLNLLPPWYRHRFDIVKVVVEDGVTAVGDYSFFELCWVKEVSLPESLRRIGVEAFSNNFALTTVEIPAAVERIDTRAFIFCKNLKDIRYGNGKTVFGEDVFRGSEQAEICLETDSISRTADSVMVKSGFEQATEVFFAIYDADGRMVDVRTPEKINGLWQINGEGLDLNAFAIKIMGTSEHHAPVKAPETMTPALRDEEPEEKPEPEKVTYFCTIGAYLDTLIEAVNEYNAGEGAEEGVYIEVTSNINDGAIANEVLMQAGTFHDISDGCSNQAWVLNGWVKDLYEVAEMDGELANLIASYKPYMVPGLEEVNGILTSLPLEVVPVKLAVNTDLLDKYGYKLPKTIDEMVDIAIGIYEQSGGKAYGWGGSTWSAMVRRLLFKATVNSTGTMHWDPNTGTYDFSPFKKIIEAYAKMYQAGAVLGLDNLPIDAIRAEFAAGKVAFFPAPSYDVAVYTKFPATCNWTVIDMPAYEETGAPYKGIYLDRVSCGICAPAFDAATPEHQKAVIEAYKFLNSDELYARVYARGQMIPYKREIIRNTPLESGTAPQWAAMADIEHYTSMPRLPDNVIPLEESPYGLTYQQVMLEVIRGRITFNQAVADLNERYNAAAQAAMEDPDIDMDLYRYPWSAELS